MQITIGISAPIICSAARVVSNRVVKGALDIIQLNNNINNNKYKIGIYLHSSRCAPMKFASDINHTRHLIGNNILFDCQNIVCVHLQKKIDTHIYLFSIQPKRKLCIYACNKFGGKKSFHYNVIF